MGFIHPGRNKVVWMDIIKMSVRDHDGGLMVDSLLDVLRWLMKLLTVLMARR